MLHFNCGTKYDLPFKLMGVVDFWSTKDAGTVLFKFEKSLQTPTPLFSVALGLNPVKPEKRLVDEEESEG